MRVTSRGPRVALGAQASARVSLAFLAPFFASALAPFFASALGSALLALALGASDFAALLLTLPPKRRSLSSAARSVFSQVKKPGFSLRPK